MAMSSQQAFVLFALGRCYEECDRRFAGKFLEIDLNKKVFIGLAQKAGMVVKGERAMYQNLEDLEQSKLISYDNRCLHLTPRGEKKYQELLSKIEPYLAVSLLLRSDDILKYAHVQAKFK